MRAFVVVVTAACAVLACGKRDSATVDGKPRPGDAAAIDSVHADAVSHLDASDPDAVTYLDAAPVDAAHADATHSDAAHSDAAHPDAVSTLDAAHVDAGHPDAVITVDASHPDAAVHLDAAMPDAGTSSTNVVTCYEEGNPSQTCTLPVHCCFSNYSSYHDGVCTTAACLYGTISCDGPEDCTGGQHCCSHALFASDGSVDGYAMQCQASACGAAPANYELCHIAGPPCSNGGTCVTAYLNDNDLPRTLNICQ